MKELQDKDQSPKSNEAKTNPYGDHEALFRGLGRSSLVSRLPSGLPITERAIEMENRLHEIRAHQLDSSQNNLEL